MVRRGNRSLDVAAYVCCPGEGYHARQAPARNDDGDVDLSSRLPSSLGPL
jgi:hypothetical protein